MLDALRQDLRYAIRGFARTPGFTAAVVTTLALGIGINTALFTVLDAVLLRPLPYPQSERLVTLGDATPEGLSSNVGFTTAADWRERTRSFEHIALMRAWQPTLMVDGEAERLPAVRVSWNYFAMMGVHPALGSDFTADDDRPDHWRVVLLSDRLWRRRFNADPSIVDRVITMNDRTFRVAGVLPPEFEPLDAARYYVPAEIWAPIGYDVAMRDACRSCRHLRAFGRLKPDVSFAAASAEMNALREQLRREHPNDYETGSIAIVPLREAIAGHTRSALLILMTGVAVVLLIACANTASLLLARSLTRRREIALRAALGAGRFRIVCQLLTESLLLSLAGAALGVGLAALTVKGLAAVAPISLPRIDHVSVDARVLAFSALVGAVTTLLCGLVPAWYSARIGSTARLDDSRTLGRGVSGGRSALVVATLAVALVLLASAGLMLRTVAAITRQSPGFDPSRVFTLQFSLIGKAYADNAAVVAFQNQFLESVRALPEVADAALAGQIPFGGDFDCWGFHGKGRMKTNPIDDPCIQRYSTTPDYLRVMGIPLRAGRFFEEQDLATTQPLIVISETTARAVWGHDNPIGSEVRLGDADRGPWRTVIGIVADSHHESVTAPLTAAFYTPQTQQTDSFLVAAIKLKESASSDPLPKIKTILRALDPSIPTYAIASLDDLVSKAAAQQLFVMRLLTAFGCLALLLAAVGLHGAVSHIVVHRTRELGVRRALGASGANVAALVLTHGTRLLVGGVLIGLGSIVMVTRYLRSLIYGVTPLDPLTLAGAVAVLAAVAISAHWLPVQRALRVDPAVTLRQDQ